MWQLVAVVVETIPNSESLLQYEMTYDEMMPFGSAGGSQLRCTPLLPTMSQVSWRGAEGPVTKYSK